MYTERSLFFKFIMNQGVDIPFNNNSMFYLHPRYTHAKSNTDVILSHATHRGVSRRICKLVNGPEECAILTEAM